MGIKLGKLLKNIASAGTTWMRDQKQAKKKKKRAAALQEQMAADAERFAQRDLGQTAFGNVQADPAMIAAQQRALQRTEAVAREGYTATDKAAMQQQLRDAARYEQGQRQSLQQDAQARGMGGSGFNIQSQLAAQQSGADRATETATNLAIEGRDRAQAANQQAAQMAGGMRDQGFGEQSTVAGATDQYGQWRANTQGTDFANLQAARAGTVGGLQQAAAEQEDSPNANLAVNALATYYTGGLAGNVAGGQPTNAVGTPGGGTAKNVAGVGPATPPGGAQQKTQAPGMPPQTPPPQAPIAGAGTKAMPGAMPQGRQPLSLRNGLGNGPLAQRMAAAQQRPQGQAPTMQSGGLGNGPLAKRVAAAQQAPQRQMPTMRAGGLGNGPLAQRVAASQAAPGVKPMPAAGGPTQMSGGAGPNGPMARRRAGGGGIASRIMGARMGGAPRG